MVYCSRENNAYNAYPILIEKIIIALKNKRKLIIC